jgi:hypothetical protein
VGRRFLLSSLSRVTGPFVVEATIPTPVDWEGDGVDDSGTGEAVQADFAERMLEVLRNRLAILRFLDLGAAEAGLGALRGYLPDDGGIHGCDNIAELGRLSGPQQKGGG